MKKLFIRVFLFTLLDQFIKGGIQFFMSVGQSFTIIKNFFNLTYVQNTGAAFSILEGNRNLFLIAGLIGINLIYFTMIKDKNLSKFELLIYSILISGILGNMIDRFLFAYVIDYLDFNIFGYNFAIFNLADTFIVIAAMIILGLSIWEEKNAFYSRRK